MTATSTVRSHSAAVPAIGWLAVLAGVGCALLAVGHMGVEVPVLSAAGPGGDRAVPQAAIAFGAATVLYGVLAVGVFRRTRWAWPAAVAVNGLAVLAGLGQFRGVASAVGLAIAVASLALLASPAGRRDLRRGSP